MREAAQKEGRTVLYVSHNMNTIRQLCDRCVVLEKGKVIFQGGVEEGIEVYLGGKKSSANIVDLSSNKREGQLENHEVTMTELAVVDNEKLLYKVGETLKAQLKMVSKKDFDDVFVRVMIRTTEGTSVTMSSTQKGFKVKKNVETTLSMVVDTSRLVPGKYSLNILVYQVDKFGQTVSLDGLVETLFFNIVTVPGFNNNMEWTPKHWGNMFSDALQIKQLD